MRPEQRWPNDSRAVERHVCAALMRAETVPTGDVDTRRAVIQSLLVGDPGYGQRGMRPGRMVMHCPARA